MSAAEQTLASGDAVPLSLRGPAPTRVVAGYGFWLFLLSDIIIFAALFAAYAVLSGETAGGPTAADLFDKRHVLIETACLLASSVTCGFGSLAVQSGDRNSTYFWMAITLILGVAFLSLEVGEFSHMLSIGAGPSRRSLPSAFLALGGTHGLHVTIGLCWLIVMLLQVATLGFQPMVSRRFFCFGLFCHGVDSVWLGVFTIVYLGAHL